MLSLEGLVVDTTCDFHAFTCESCVVPRADWNRVDSLFCSDLDKCGPCTRGPQRDAVVGPV